MNTDEEIMAGRGLKVDPGRIGDWAQTWSGRRFYPQDPRPEDIAIVDIAHALGNMARYNGHCRFYSVAEHSVLVSKIVPMEDALAGLLHDAPEAILADVIRPVKRALPPTDAYFHLERLIWSQCVAPKFYLDLDLPPSVKLADGYQVIELEKRALHPRSDHWDLKGHKAPAGLRIECYPPIQAALMFIDRLCEIIGTQAHGHRSEFFRLWAEDSEALWNQ